MGRVQIVRRFICAWAVAVALPPALAAQTIHCDALRTSASAFAGRCVQRSTAVALIVLRPPETPPNGRGSGTVARVFGHANDSTSDALDWTAISPMFVDVGNKNGVFAWCWCTVTNATVDTEGLHFDA